MQTTHYEERYRGTPSEKKLLTNISTVHIPDKLDALAPTIVDMSFNGFAFFQIQAHLAKYLSVRASRINISTWIRSVKTVANIDTAIPINKLRSIDQFRLILAAIKIQSRTYELIIGELPTDIKAIHEDLIDTYLPTTITWHEKITLVETIHDSNSGFDISQVERQIIDAAIKEAELLLVDDDLDPDNWWKDDEEDAETGFRIGDVEREIIERHNQKQSESLIELDEELGLPFDEIESLDSFDFDKDEEDIERIEGVELQNMQTNAKHFLNNKFIEEYLQENIVDNHKIRKAIEIAKERIDKNDYFFVFAAPNDIHPNLNYLFKNKDLLSLKSFLYCYVEDDGHIEYHSTEILNDFCKEQYALVLLNKLEDEEVISRFFFAAAMSYVMTLKNPRTINSHIAYSLEDSFALNDDDLAYYNWGDGDLELDEELGLTFEESEDKEGELDDDSIEEVIEPSIEQLSYDDANARLKTYALNEAESYKVIDIAHHFKLHSVGEFTTTEVLAELKEAIKNESYYPHICEFYFGLNRIQFQLNIRKSNPYCFEILDEADVRNHQVRLYRKFNNNELTKEDLLELLIIHCVFHAFDFMRQCLIYERYRVDSITVESNQEESNEDSFDFDEDDLDPDTWGDDEEDEDEDEKCILCESEPCTCFDDEYEDDELTPEEVKRRKREDLKNNIQGIAAFCGIVAFLFGMGFWVGYASKDTYDNLIIVPNDQLVEIKSIPPYTPAEFSAGIEAELQKALDAIQDLETKEQVPAHTPATYSTQIERELQEAAEALKAARSEVKEHAVLEK